MFYVYLLRSQSSRDKTYIGITNDVNRRLIEHNKGYNKTTRSCIPWEIEVYIAFTSEEKAIQFEKYLKQGSGHAFARKHFWNSE